MRTSVLSLTLGLAAIVITTEAVSAQSMEKPYCLETAAGAKNCIYESLERCQQMAGARSIGGRCVANPTTAGTVGTGSMDAPRGTGPHSLDRVPAPVK
jgi:hypothetical protein